jgi:hypothetical protein
MTRQEALVMLETQNAYDVGACQRAFDDLDIDPRTVRELTQRVRIP